MHTNASAFDILRIFITTFAVCLYEVRGIFIRQPLHYL